MMRDRPKRRVSSQSPDPDQSPDPESGIAALEFALVLPILLILLLGIISMGHGMVVRYVLNAATYEAARSCAMNRTPTQGCSVGVINNTISSAGGVNWCSSVTITSNNAPDSALPAVTNFTVTADCAYNGIVPITDTQTTISLLNIRARAVMPY